MKTLEELKQEMDAAWADWWYAATWDAAWDAAYAAWGAAYAAYNKRLKELEDEDA